MSKEIASTVLEELLSRLQQEHNKAKRYAKFILHFWPGLSTFRIIRGDDPDRIKEDYEVRNE